MKGVAILGSTGSVGVSTLDVIRRNSQEMRAVALTALSNDERLFHQCHEFRPDVAVLVDRDAAARLEKQVKAAGLPTEVLGGAESLKVAARWPQAQSVMAAIVGAAGLLPTLAAARAGKQLLLANKEALVMAGNLLIEAVHAGGGVLIPIDSEHNAIFQCLPGDIRAGVRPPGVRRVLLTASGGPFLRLPVERLVRVTPDEACAHPRWAMGRKISVDSATLMNKGLELIEACHLFGLAADEVDVVVHPQSIVHSMVEYLDGSVLAQLGNPDMRIPIAHALAWPQRRPSGADRLDLVAIGRLDFEAPDMERFPCLAYAQAAARAGGTAPAILNAANEMAVQTFLERRLNFAAIPEVIEAVFETVETIGNVSDLEVILQADAQARSAAAAVMQHPVTELHA